MYVITELTLLIGVFAVSFGCKCLEVDYKNKLSAADFVLDVEIATGLLNIGQPSFDDSSYGFKFKKAYKGCYQEILNDVTYPNENQLFTATQSATCGVTWLQTGQRYLISGRLAGGKLSIHICGSLVFDLHNLDGEQIMFLRRIKRKMNFPSL